MIHELYIEQLKLKVAKAIQEYATENKMTQSDMAYILQTNQPRISNMYAGLVHKFKLDCLLVWAYNLGIKIDINIGE